MRSSKIILIVDKSKRAAASLGELSDHYRAGQTASRPSPYLVVGLASRNLQVRYRHLIRLPGLLPTA
jgi:hypothetical protein